MVICLSTHRNNSSHWLSTPLARRQRGDCSKQTISSIIRLSIRQSFGHVFPHIYWRRNINDVDVEALLVYIFMHSPQNGFSRRKRDVYIDLLNA